jgi:hypothetical protein
MLAALHLVKNHETPVEELQTQVLAMLQSDTASRSIGEAASGITGVRKFTSTVENGFSSITTNMRSVSAEQEASEISFYIFTIENQIAQTRGFALACGDIRIGNVLAIVEDGEWDDTENPFTGVFFSYLADYILNTIEMYNSITDGDIEAALVNLGSGSNARSVYSPTFYDNDAWAAPLTKATRWYQKEPYWDVINSVAGSPNFPDNHKLLTGCVATAVAQIMAYHEWPKKPFPYPIQFIDPYLKTTTSFSQITYEWEKMKRAYYANWLSNEAKTEIGVLMLEIGANVKIKYGADASNAYTDDVPAALERMGYNRPPIMDYKAEYVIASIMPPFRTPVYVSGYAKKKYYAVDIFKWFPIYDGGHAWVIDAFRVRTLYINLNGLELCLPYCQVHCNLGWSGFNNGWYISGIFDASLSGGPVEIDRSAGDKDMYFQYKLKIIPLILPIK